MCTSCGGAKATNVAGTASSVSSFGAGASSGYVVYLADGSTKEVATETEARILASKSGGSFKRK